MAESGKHVEWRRSSDCANGACVEVAMVDGRYRVRDSKNPDVELSFSTSEWTAFEAGVRAGTFQFE